MSKATRYVCLRCKAVKYQLSAKLREYCHKCQQVIDNKSLRLSSGSVAPHDWKQVDDEYTVKCIDYLARQLNDFGENGPVVSLRPGTPEFMRVAAGITHIRDIGR